MGIKEVSMMLHDILGISVIFNNYFTEWNMNVL